MAVCDFSRSFVTFVTKERTNTARIQVESRCELVDEASGNSQVFWLVASCKAEETYAPKDLFKVPNYDFCAIFSDTDYTIFRTHVVDDGYIETGLNADRFEEVRIDIRWTDGERKLSAAGDIVEATVENLPLVGRTEIRDERNRLRAAIDYPVKTMNVHPERKIFQVDTGPIALPDLTSEKERWIERLELAYVAYNRFDSADFILHAPTPVIEGGERLCIVRHYSMVRTMKAKNTIWTVV